MKNFNIEIKIAAAKIFASSSSKIEKYDCLTDEKIPRQKMT